MKNRYVILSTVLASGLLASSAFAQDHAAAKPAPKAQPDKAAAPAAPAAPAGMDEKAMAQMMEAYMKAAQPGKMHEHLAKSVGNWEGKVKMWMAPGAPPQESACTSTVTSVFDGRYTKIEAAGEMPGMGPFHGLGLYGYDNVSKKFQSVWIDNMGTGMMIGTGELSEDGKTLTWNCTMNDAMTGKPAACREVDHFDNDNTMRLEMFGQDPSGKEYKAMEITYTRTAGGKSDSAAKAASHAPSADHGKAAAAKAPTK